MFRDPLPLADGVIGAAARGAFDWGPAASAAAQVLWFPSVAHDDAPDADAEAAPLAAGHRDLCRLAQRQRFAMRLYLDIHNYERRHDLHETVA